jgi:glycosyltransferase involved in cell wall biosynthesis
MRVVAVLTVRNEEIYLARCLQHLYEQGVETCLIDNGSSDHTKKIAESYKEKGVFRIEALDYDGYYDLTKILTFAENLARDIIADWFMIHDADEVREAPAKYNNILTALKAVDSAGYNAVNFNEFVFLPTHQSESYINADFVHDMQYYYYFQPKPLHRVNLWKHADVAVDLVSSGGHQVNFEGMKICPQSFIMRHYISLSKAHAESKYANRSYAPEDLKKGWHVKRAAFDKTKLMLPDKKVMKKIPVGSREFDISKPFKKHLLFND